MFLWYSYVQERTKIGRFELLDISGLSPLTGKSARLILSENGVSEKGQIVGPHR